MIIFRNNEISTAWVLVTATHNLPSADKQCIKRSIEYTYYLNHLCPSNFNILDLIL